MSGLLWRPNQLDAIAVCGRLAEQGEGAFADMRALAEVVVLVAE